MFTEFMEQRGPGHTAGGKNFYIKGYGDYKKEIEQAIKELDYFNDPEAYDKEQSSSRSQLTVRLFRSTNLRPTGRHFRCTGLHTLVLQPS